ncbi:PIR protein [Plasmodium vivax]|uniref:VIR protein n=1 Tax=Plasmodium vivax TaxID=5855 RepID=A0A565A764_PLAVI|nr:PIR protein [Plasmodium vivax]
MDCTDKIINYETYDFFENAINYIDISDNLESSSIQLDKGDDCTSFSSEYTSSNLKIGENVCKLFIKLYKSLNNVTNRSHGDYKKEWHFLNYWLNINISKSKLNETTCATEFFDGLSHHCWHTLGIDFPPPSSIYNITEENLKKMSLLYGLYENYRILNNILITSPQDKPGLLLEPSTKCCSDYAEANYLCNGKGDKFCEELQKFKSTYQDLYDTEIGKHPEYMNNFKKLSECKKNNVMSTALIGTTVGLVPLLMGLYKYGNNDDKIRNTMLMDQEIEHISSQQGTYNIKYHSV